MTTKTLEATLESVGSHTVSSRGNYSHGTHESEECFPVLSVELAGQVREVRMEANRYQHSSGWSDWRIFIRDISPMQGVGDVGREKLRDVCTPIVETWLDSDEYKVSRSRAFVWFIKRQISEERYNVTRPASVLASNQGELSDVQYELLDQAVHALAAYLGALEAIDRESI